MNGRAPTLVRTARGPVELVTEGDGPTVLALHGAMGGWDQSLLLARTIGEPGYRYLGVSRPGYLGTPLSSGRSAEEQADLCAALLDSLGVDRVGVMAVSGGGPAAIHFALRHPQRCRALVLVSTCATAAPAHPPLAFYVGMFLARFRYFAEKAEHTVRADFDAAASRSMPDPVERARVLGDPEVGPLYRELMLSTATRVAERVAGTKNDIRISSSCEFPLEDIRVPTLIVHGAQDAMLPIEKHGRAFARRIPGAELVAAEGGGHVSIYTHHALVKPRVVGFLREQLGLTSRRSPAASCASTG